MLTAMIMYPMAMPTSEKSSTLFRPYRSENAPSIGAAKNWHSGNMPTKNPRMVVRRGMLVPAAMMPPFS